MADLQIIKAQRWNEILQDFKDVIYLASSQTDGLIYFNDDMFWRCKLDGSRVELWYPNKQIWMLTALMKNITIEKMNLRANTGTTGEGNGGSGSGVAPNANVEAAVQWMINKANSEYITYSQDIRNLKNPNGTSYDCSSFVITGFYIGGFDAASSYTGDMRTGFTALGFTWIPGSVFYADDCIRGDILLNEVLHTQVYIGNNQDVNCGSTPACVQGHSNDNYGSYWDGILRYEG